MLDIVCLRYASGGQASSISLLPSSFILILLLAACPDPPETTDCGVHQIEVNGDCECEEGYYWNEDQTKCLMDTTSHNFVWEIDTLGDYGSYLNDVAIIDENNVWVVGNIKTDSGIFNAAHWNGNEWELILIGVQGVIGEGIFYFAENDIWVATGIIYHWNGEEWERYHLWDMGVLGPNDGGVTSIWGSATNNLYFVGRHGSIVHYDGSTFTRMESGTEVDLLDIDGTPDGEHIFAFGWDYAVPAGNIVLEYNDAWNTIYYKEGYLPSLDDYGGVEGIGIFRDTLYVSTAAGLWKYDYLNKTSNLIPNSITQMDYSAFEKIHVLNTNDIFFAGSGMKYIHFNGITYYYSQEITDMYPQRAMNGSDYNGNIAVMVGYFNWWEGALVVRGYHE